MRLIWVIFLLVGQVAMASGLPLIEEVDRPKYWVEQSGSGVFTPGEQRRNAEARRLMRLHGSVYVSMEYTIDLNGRVIDVTPTAIEPAGLNPEFFTVLQKYKRFKAAPGVPPAAIRVRVTRQRNWIPGPTN
jgi:hypothetical protein